MIKAVVIMITETRTVIKSQIRQHQWDQRRVLVFPPVRCEPPSENSMNGDTVSSDSSTEE